MHEFAICENLVEAVLAELKKIDAGQGRLLTTRVVVGNMRQIVPEYLEQAYEILTKDTSAEGSKLEIKPMPITGKCKECGWRGEMPMDNFCCQSCEAGKVEIVGGMELYLENLEVEAEEGE